MARMGGGEAVVAALRAEGVSHAFGVIGTAMLDVLDALYDASDITYVGVRHESNGVHMADAFARVRRRAGVALAAQPGPGATNLVTGVAEARLAYSPVVAIAGHTTTAHLHRDTFQEVDQQALFAPITKRTVTVPTAARIPEYLAEAFRVSQTGRYGPVVVNIPGDLLAQQVDVEPVAPAGSRAQGGPAPAPSDLDRAVQLLARAERPLIFAGGGVVWAGASDRLAELSRRTRIPVVASAGHGDVLPADHPLYGGQVGPRGNAVATGLAREADVILALGTRLGFNTTFFSGEHLSTTATLIQVDIEPSAVGRHYPVAVGMVADAGEAIDALATRLAADDRWAGWSDDLTRARADLLTQRAAARSDGGDGSLEPAAVCAAIQRVLPRDAIVTVDTGTCSLRVTDVIGTFAPPSLLTPLDFGLVGFSFAAGLGAKAAAPERPVVSLIGDGGFSMSMAELGTALEAGLNTVTVVMNNDCWGAEKAYQRDYFGGRYVGADLVNPAFDEVATAFGANGVQVATDDELTGAVADALRADRPTVIEVPIDPASITSFRKGSFPHREPKG